MKFRKIFRRFLPAKIYYSNHTNHFKLYQIKPTKESRKYMYIGIDVLDRMGWELNSGRYTLVYTDKMGNRVSPNDIFIRFNRDIPRNFRGRPMSVSDILVMCINGKKTTYYVDACGFKELPDSFWDN